MMVEVRFPMHTSPHHTRGPERSQGDPVQTPQGLSKKCGWQWKVSTTVFRPEDRLWAIIQ